VAGELGFEPRLAESESAVLPLDDSPPSRLGFYAMVPANQAAEHGKSALPSAGCALFIVILLAPVHPAK
jgi:hypothetical protein